MSNNQKAAIGFAIALAAAVPCYAQTANVTVEELVEAHLSNPIAAKRRFSDFVVSGVVDSITEGRVPGSAHVTFLKVDRTKSDLMAYFVLLDTTEEDVLSLSVGKVASFRCSTSKKESIGTAYLKLGQCRVFP